MPNVAESLCLGMVLAIASSSSASARDAGSHVSQDASPHLSEIADHSGRPADDRTVPISVENGQVIVDVTINDQGPFPMLFDTGGVEAVTPETATALGLAVNEGGTARGGGEDSVSVGLTHVRNIRLGAAQLFDLPLPVVPLPRFFTDRGSRPRLAGFIGYELLARFVVRLDYESRTMTTAARDFQYQGTGERVPLGFAGKIPIMPAAADGIAGQFEIDTGSSAAVVLTRGFVEQHKFSIRHPSAFRMKVGGIDGVFETSVTRLGSLDIANSEIERPAAELPLDGKVGLPIAGVDGSIGYQILRQFVITFDYSRRELWFEHSAAFGAETVQWKTGFQAVKADGSGFWVANVVPNTPASAAGISVDDVIKSMVDLPTRSAKPSSET